jgi:hypothetical protein
MTATGWKGVIRAPLRGSLHGAWSRLMAPLLVVAAACSGGVQADSPAVVGSTSSSDPERGYLTVAEVWERADELDGTQVTVRGFGFLEPDMTHIGCSPPTCDCNWGSGYLRLFHTPLDYGWTDPWVGVPEVSCGGNYCFNA